MLSARGEVGPQEMHASFSKWQLVVWAQSSELGERILRITALSIFSFAFVFDLVGGFGFFFFFFKCNLCLLYKCAF